MTSPSPHLIKSVSADNANELLKAWLWLVDKGITVLFASLFGDLFLRYPDQSVKWLDTGTGDLTQLAANTEEFYSVLQYPENHDYWLLPDLVQDAAQAGLILGPAEVYSFTLLPLLGGEYKPNNLYPTELQTHLDLTGTLHEQLSGLPDGTEVKFKVAD
ncbi:hypothetical protein GCM10027048_03650 [Hymenobacter coalescens]